jgi:hypothetical protein
VEYVGALQVAIIMGLYFHLFRYTQAINDSLFMSHSSLIFNSQISVTLNDKFVTRMGRTLSGSVHVLLQQRHILNNLFHTTVANPD